MRCVTIWPDPCVRWTLNLYTIIVYVLFIRLILKCVYTLIYCRNTEQNEVFDLISDTFFWCAVVGIALKVFLCACGLYVPP